MIRYLVILLIFPSCYSAKKQFAKAVTHSPEIAADYCARTYPPEVKVKSDTVTTFDTIYTGGQVLFDTVVVQDVKYITKTVQLPGTHVIERQVIHDTVTMINTAALDLARIELGKAITLATDKTEEAEGWKKKAKIRFWIILGLGAVMAVGLFLKLRNKFANIKTTD